MRTSLLVVFVIPNNGMNRFISLARRNITQIMNLLGLAPDIQETILFLPLVSAGKDPVTERGLREVVAEVGWGKQRRLWSAIHRSA